ncbi:MAG: L-lactate permease, partial [Actinomycetota bacterium]
VTWGLAAAPIGLLLVLVLLGRTSAALNGLLTVAAAAAVGVVAFGAGPLVIGVGVVKGVWTGVWILCVVWAALLVFHLTREMGLMRLGDLLSSILPRPVENVLVVAWIFPSLIQGVAGFGTPIAVAAPLLATMGVSPVRAVALPLVGYHWAVGFGSMGSSFYMGALTGGLEGEQVGRYATIAAAMLGTSAVLSGALVCLLHSGWHGLRQGWRVVLVAGAAMAGVQGLTVQLEPAIGAVSGAAAGLLAVGALRAGTTRGRRERTALPASVAASSASGAATPAPPPKPASTEGRADSPPGPRQAVLVMVPYVVLIAVVLTVYLPTASRTWVKEHLLVGPSLPATVTAAGHENASVGPYTPIALLGHPATYLLLAAAVALMVWKATGTWPSRRLGATLRAWRKQALKASPPVLLLATVATVMADTGMVRAIAIGAARVTGDAFPAVAPLVGMTGAFTTGSTTSANALFAGLQSQVGELIDVPPSTLLAAQLAGGNIGNIVAPMVIAIGVTGLAIRGQESQVLRLVAMPALLLNNAVT